MERVSSKFTVMFDEPFWIGLYEREHGGKYEVCKITFGAEPKDGEVYEFLLKNWNRLKFSPAVEGSAIDDRRINPKRLQRQIKRDIADTGIGTKAQQALKLQQEQGKLARKKFAREQTDKEKERQFELRQQKRKEKHRGH